MLTYIQLPTRRPWRSRPVQSPSPRPLMFGDMCTFYGCYRYTYERQPIKVNGTLIFTPKRVVGVALNSTTCVIGTFTCVNHRAVMSHSMTFGNTYVVSELYTIAN